MSQAIKFTDLAAAVEEPKPRLQEAAKKGLEVEIEVAGPKEVEAKTIQLKLDQRGLIQLSFKEGGQLPALLAGRFTGLEDVKTALLVWQERRAKEFKLDENIQHPHAANNGKSLTDLVDEAAKGDSPKFPEVKVEDETDFVNLDDSEE